MTFTYVAESVRYEGAAYLEHELVPASSGGGCSRCGRAATHKPCPGKRSASPALLVATEAVTCGDWQDSCLARGGDEEHHPAGPPEVCRNGLSPEAIATGISAEDAAAYCAWRYLQDSEECRECGGEGSVSGCYSDCGDGSGIGKCEACRGTGRVLRVPCCDKYGNASGGEWTVTAYIPAPDWAKEAAQRPCPTCDRGSLGAEWDHIRCPDCSGTGKVGPLSELVIAAEIAT